MFSRITPWSFALAASVLPMATAPATAERTHYTFAVDDARDLPDLAIDGRCAVDAGPHTCTLRAALAEINAASGGPHRVRLDATTVQLALQHGALVLASGVHVEIQGRGPDSVISGGGPGGGVQLFSVPPGATLVLRHLALVDGTVSCCGGAITNLGDVFAKGVWFRSNRSTASGIAGPAGTGGAIYNGGGGRMLLLDSIFATNQSRGSGGAIRNDGLLGVGGSSFVANDGFAGGGGAIANAGQLYLLNSTFSANHSAGAGAVWNTPTGRLFGFSLTFAENFTHTGGPWTTLDNSPGGLLWLANSLVTAAQPGANCSGAVASGGFNLSNDASCQFAAIGDVQSGDAALAPLAFNGGPTPTHALLPGSDALDQGFCGGVDQRGVHRPVDIHAVANAGNGCDIGAFELRQRERR
jgi:hypothetical protein